MRFEIFTVLLRNKLAYRYLTLELFLRSILPSIIYMYCIKIILK